jgi:hypothetical protein
MLRAQYTLDFVVADNYICFAEQYLLGVLGSRLLLLQRSHFGVARS